MTQQRDHESDIVLAQSPPNPARPLALVVEDDADCQRGMALVLEHLGYTVLTATNGTDALDALDKRGDDIGLIVADIIIPAPDGLVVIDAACAWQPPIPVIATTGAGTATMHLLQEARIRGAVAVLRKPFESGDLVRAVNNTRADAAGHAVS